MEFTIAVVFWVIVGGLVGGMIGKARGHETQGMVLGALLGVLGWVIALVGSDDRPKCKECGGVIVPGARRCKNCGMEIGGGLVHGKFAPAGGEWEVRPVAPGSVKLKCPNCGEYGFVPTVSEGLKIVCPLCKETFEAAENFAKA